MPDRSADLRRALEGRYRLERELGQGGMATVYLAHDLKHERQVALKVLKPELAAVVGAERFLAEIKTTANLQHPNILPLFDSGDADGFLFYVMPYVEGESLREKLEREGQLHLDEAVRLAGDVAEALHAAHEQGVIHRDIKPANILLSRGRPLVADFGIALAVSEAGGGRLTETGLSLGTPFYMSPEQASGERTPTAASDVYALGSVLYEMLVGEPPYTGATAQAVLGKILLGSPTRPTQLRKTIPAHVEGAVLKALEKLPADRFDSATAFARALRDPGFRHVSGGAAAAETGGTSWRSRLFAGAAAAVFATGVWAWAQAGSDSVPVTRFVVGLDGEEALWYTGTANLPRLTISPDGSRIIYVGWDPARARGRLLRLKEMGQLASVELAGTEEAEAPSISPDGEFVAFLGEAPGNESSLEVASLLGGAPITVVSDGVTAGPAWSPDGWIHFVGPDGRTLMRVSAAGGPTETVTTLDLGPEYSRYMDPFFASDETLIVTALGTTRDPEVHVVDLASGTSIYSVLGSGGLATPSGHLLYVTAGGTLMAQELGRPGEPPRGRPTQILDGVGVRSGRGIVDVTLSANGTLLYTTQPAEAPERWVWVGADGSVELMDPTWTEDIEFEGMALSPDGRRLAVDMASSDRVDIFLKALDGGPPSRLTFDGDGNRRPTWSPDGRRVGYISVAGGRATAMVRAADGTGSAEPLFDHERDVFEVRWSPDGAWLLAVLEGSSYDIVAQRLGSTDEPVAILASEFDEWEPALSPDGRWLAYVSTELGQAQVFVVPFPNVGDGKWQISADGGREPRWSADGTRLFIRHEDGNGIDVADLTAGPNAPRRSPVLDFPPEEYFEVNGYNHLYEVGADGRFLMLRAGQGDITGDLVIVQGFFRELEERMGG
jgi:serine/threonine-protein kinase